MQIPTHSINTRPVVTSTRRVQRPKRGLPRKYDFSARVFIGCVEVMGHIIQTTRAESIAPCRLYVLQPFLAVFRVAFCVRPMASLSAFLTQAIQVWSRLAASRSTAAQNSAGLPMLRRPSGRTGHNGAGMSRRGVTCLPLRLFGCANVFAPVLCARLRVVKKDIDMPCARSQYSSTMHEIGDWVVCAEGTRPTP